ncbi:putative PDDEXK endonuclease [Paraburkholderia saeva]|uniref:putative PDDEXK endonuclease n=1 Tax=Paraburkholderia saeva TaxID=2777537 RepID=UPI001DB06926|nr:hypothetical protein [Paraburkholderia saeva]CAG4924650.1 hypothetical protein R52603_05287 [Paraburkholderia saeva]
MGLASRTKGQAGERELAHLLACELGADVRRRCRQHPNDSDLLGIDGWAIECKRVKSAPRGDVATWWRQCVGQSQANGELPALFVRADRSPWRCIWPALVLIGGTHTDEWLAFEWTAESSLQTWCAVVREYAAAAAARERVPACEEASDD